MAVEVVERARLLGRQPEHPEVAVLVDQLVPVLHHVVPGPEADVLTQPVGVGDLELELRHDPEHPDGDLGRVQQVEVRLADLAHVTGRRHEAYAAHDAGQAGVARAGAVRPGRHGAGDLLGVDVALVAQRQPDLPQRFVEVADQRAGERGRALRRDVGADDASQCREVEQQAVGPDHRREGVPGARDADRWPRSAAWRTRAATSSSSRGAAVEAGEKDWLPTQLVQVMRVSLTSGGPAVNGGSLACTPPVVAPRLAASGHGGRGVRGRAAPLR